MSEPRQPRSTPDATERLLAPRKRRHHRSKNAAARRKSRLSRLLLAVAATAATALVVLLVGLAFWLWHRPPPPAPMPDAGMAEILAAPSTLDWRWNRLRDNPAVLVLEFPNLGEQGSTMNRMAAYLEKRAGPRDRLLDNRELADLIKRSGDNPATFFFGHDYSLDRIAQFYSLAESQKLQLNGQEMRLRENLLRWSILHRELDGSFHSTTEHALITFTSTQLDDPATPQDETVDATRRESVLRHEISHGEFFTNGVYRLQCWDFWRKGLTEAERQNFRHYLASLDYDPANEELMVNETQAVLMHTPDTRAFNASDLGITEVQLNNLRSRFTAAAK